MKKYMETLQPCRNLAYTDCAACVEGKCTALSDTRFEDDECPFFKPKEEAHKAKLRSIAHLIWKDRIDLIKRYYGNDVFGRRNV